MKKITFITVIFLFGISTYAQTRQGDILSQEYSKEITEYYCKQYIIDEVLKVPDRQNIEVYIAAITAAKSGEITTVLYQCDSFNKKGIVFAFWNDFSTGVGLPYKGYGFYDLDLEKAKELFDHLESLMNPEKNTVSILNYDFGNLVYKSDDLTFLFYNGDVLGYKPIRVWWKTFNSDWNQANLRTTIKRFRTFFDLTK